MSGGFFRGTSADQDTRFSNKQAKLLKSQKFAPELENLVDMSKVKMDVIKPWIAKRVTELIGFEDEVLINFIYGLLEGKAVNGKEIQISLTGFMERNTGKFMKELWLLLLSAEQNVSGVPQQFLDAKEEETKKKKAETERIANEIHRNREKEKLEFEQEKTRMGGEDLKAKDRRPELELDIKNGGRESTTQPTEDREKFKRSGRKGHRDSRSPDFAHRSPSPPRKYSASPNKSSNPRSHSNERRRSHSTSGAASSRSRSISSERSLGRQRSATPPRRRNIRRSPSPLHASLRSRRRSTSHSRHRSPSPTRQKIRSPLRRRSRSPVRRRSRSPVRRRSRSPVRRRSRSPMRVHPRSRTPIRRSPVRYRTPVRRRSPSPVRRRSPSPVRRRSPSPVRRRSPSPVRRRSPYRKRHRSPSPSFDNRRSLSPPSSSPSPIHRQLASPTLQKLPSLHRPSSPARRRSHRSPPNLRQQSISPARGRFSLRGRKRSVTPVRRRSPAMEEFSPPSHAHRGSLSPIRRESMKSGRSPMQSSKERARRDDNYSVHRGSSDGRAELSVENRKGVKSAESMLPIVSLRSPQRDTLVHQDDLPGKNQDLSSPVQKSPFVSHVSRSASYSDERRSTSPHSIHGTHARADGAKLEKTQPISSDKLPDRADHKEHHTNKELSITSKATGLSVKGRESYDDDGARAKDKKTSRSDSKSTNKLPQQVSLSKLARKSELNDQNGSFYSPSKENNEAKVKEKRKHRKSDSQEEESDDYSSYDSYEDRKEAKRRRKEEKKVKKEKRRRRREERRRRKEERRAEKLKLKSGDSGSSSSDLGQHHSEEDSVKVRKSHASNIKETESEQKRLEIELREKALETLRAKKGLGN